MSEYTACSENSCECLKPNRRPNFLFWIIFALSVLFAFFLGLIIGSLFSGFIFFAVPALIVSEIVIGVVLLVFLLVAHHRRR